MEEVNTKIIKIARSKSGVPCLWESFMKFSDLTRSTIIVDKHGNAKGAFFINAEKDKQALVPISTGDYMCKCFEDKNGIAISVFEISDISSMKNEATITPVYRKSSLVSDYKVPKEYEKTVEYALSKFQKGENIVISQARERSKTAYHEV
jgi:hypothetical protein